MGIGWQERHLETDNVVGSSAKERLLRTDDVREGVVVLPKGLWTKHTANGQTANALSPDTLTDIAGGACFNDARVEVQKV